MTENEQTIEKIKELRGKIQRGEIKLKEPNWFQRTDWVFVGLMSFLTFCGLIGAGFAIGLLLLFIKLVIWVWSL